MSAVNTNTTNARPALEKLNHSNFVDWFRQLRIILKGEGRLYVIDTEPPADPGNSGARADRDAYRKHMDDAGSVSCFMLTSMIPELQKGFEDSMPFEMANKLKEMFQEQARAERFRIVKDLSGCKMTPGSSVSTHVLKMKGYLDRLEKLNAPFPKDLAIDLILGSLPPGYEQFIINYNMHNMDKSVSELHGMLKSAEPSIKAKSAQKVYVVEKGGESSTSKRKNKRKKKKGKLLPKTKVGKKRNVKDDICHRCGKKGHWMRNCPIHLEEKRGSASASGIFIVENFLTTYTSWILDTGCGSHICNNVQGLKTSRKLKKGEVDLRVGNGAKVAALAVGTFCITLPSGFVLELNNCYFIPALSKCIISVSCLIRDGYQFVIGDKNSINKNDVCFANVVVKNGLYILDLESENYESLYNVNAKRFKHNNLNQTYIWHCRLGHINEKRIAKLHSHGLLDSFELESYEACESCLLGKMTRSPFTKLGERASELLELIHTDVCGPMSVPWF
jgi:hypothetical protein